MESARQIASVVGVLGFLLLAAYWLRRHTGALHLSTRKTRMVEVIERVVLTPQHSLHVVRVAGEVFLLSAGPGGVGLIRNLEQPGAAETPGAGT